MVKTTVEYRGDLGCMAHHGPSGATIQTDAPVDNHGKGACFSPTDLMAASLGTCIATVIGILAQRRGWDLKGMRLEVEKVMSTTAPRRIASLPVVIWMPVLLEPAERTAVEKTAITCPVHKSLHPDIEVPIVFHWPNLAGTS